MALGIDFGTSFTAAAHADRAHLRLVELEYDRTISPSIVFVQADGGLAVGREAELAGAARPDCVLVDIKADLGRPQPYRVGARDISPEAAVAAVFAAVRSAAETRCGFALDEQVTITVPSAFGVSGSRIDAMRRAAAAAGFDPQRTAFVHEPVAAAIGYFGGDWPRPHFGPDSALLIYDLGGGTFDAAAVRISPQLAVVGLPVGDDTIGGRKFDRIILDSLLRRCSDQAQDLYDRPEDEARLPRWRGRSVAARQVCCEVKERLAVMRETPVALPDIDEPLALKLEEMEALIEPLIETTASLMQRLEHEVREANLVPAGVLLVGGSCRLPVVRRVLEARLGLPLLAAPDPARIVATGAAIEARRRGGSGNVEPSRRHGGRDGVFGKRG